MTEKTSQTVMEYITTQLDSLTPKGKLLGQCIIQNPRKAVFMTTKELSETCKVSEATVVRFVSHLGYGGYGDFLQALRDIVDTGLTLPDRIDLPGPAGPGAELLHRVLLEEMNNIKQILVMADSALCPLIQLAHQSLIIPSKSIPFIGHPTAISCMINYLVIALARQGEPT